MRKSSRPLPNVEKPLPKNGRFVASALFGVESAYGEARKMTSRQLLLQAESLGKNSRGSSVASPIVIDPKIGVFQHNRRKPAVRDDGPENHADKKVLRVAKVVYDSSHVNVARSGRIAGARNDRKFGIARCATASRPWPENESASQGGPQRHFSLVKVWRWAQSQPR
jgi:hypothetical protein